MNEENESGIREISVGYSYAIKPSKLPVMKSSSDAYDFFLQTWDMGKIEYIEQFKVMLLNHANRVLGIVLISTGGMSSTVIDTKVIFACALKCNASFLILAHNHPSGKLEPSVPDRTRTQQLLRAGKTLNLPVLDHLIITSEGYYSFADQGTL